MKKTFEYYTYSAPMTQGLTKKSFDIKKMHSEIEELGSAGWELCATIPISGNTGISWGAATAGVVFIFKKEIVA